jgi:hypothetical protein
MAGSPVTGDLGVARWDGVGLVRIVLVGRCQLGLVLVALIPTGVAAVAAWAAAPGAAGATPGTTVAAAAVAATVTAVISISVTTVISIPTNGCGRGGRRALGPCRDYRRGAGGCDHDCRRDCASGMAESQNCASSCLFEGKKSRWVYPFVVDKNARLLLLVVTRRSEAACGSLRNGRVAAFFFFHRKMFVWLQTGISFLWRSIVSLNVYQIGQVQYLHEIDRGTGLLRLLSPRSCRFSNDCLVLSPGSFSTRY